MRLLKKLLWFGCLLLAVGCRAQSVASVAVVTNHLVSNPISGLLYGSVPGSAGALGNHIVVIDPAKAQITGSIAVGSEPNILALSDNGQFLYVGLDGENAVGRINLTTSKLDLKFSLGTSSQGSFIVKDMAVLPGHPHSVAVALATASFPYGLGVAIFDDGVSRRDHIYDGTAGYDSIAFSRTPDLLFSQEAYSSAYAFRTMQIDANGIRVIRTVHSLLSGLTLTIRTDPTTGYLYSNTGRAIDPQFPHLLGQFAYTNPGMIYGSPTSILPDAAHGRVTLLLSADNVYSTALVLFDTTTYRAIASYPIPNLQAGNAGDLVSWSKGVAFRTDQSVYCVTGTVYPGLTSFTLDQNQVVGGTTVHGTVTLTHPAPPEGATVQIVTGALDSYQTGVLATVVIPSGQTKQNFAIPTFSSNVNRYQILYAQYGGQTRQQPLLVQRDAATQLYPSNVKTVYLPTSGLVYDALRHRLYASISSDTVAYKNCIVSIDPRTGAIIDSLFVGSNPGEMAISDDGQFLYVAMNGSLSIQRINLETNATDLQFWPGGESMSGAYDIYGIAVLPGDGHTIAMGQYSPYAGNPLSGIAVYDDGRMRPNVALAAANFTRTDTSSRLYTVGFERLSVDASGVSLLDSINLSAGGQVVYAGGKVFTGSGQVIDPEHLDLLGTFGGPLSGYPNSNAFDAPVLPELISNRVYFVTSINSLQTLQIFDSRYYIPLANYTVPGTYGTGTYLVSCGTNRVAFDTSGTQFILMDVTPCTLSALTVTPTTVKGGDTINVTVQLSNAAPDSNIGVHLSSSDSSVAEVPKIVKVNAGTSSTTFSITTHLVSTSKVVTLTAASGGLRTTVQFTVSP